MSKYFPRDAKTDSLSAMQVWDQVLSVIYPYIRVLGGVVTYNESPGDYGLPKGLITDIEVVGDRYAYSIYVESNYWEFSALIDETETYLYARSIHDTELVSRMLDALDVLMDSAESESWR